MGLDKLTWDYKLGSLRPPNFKMYYWASQTRMSLSLFESDSASSWTQIELYELHEKVASNILYKWNSKTISATIRNPLTIHLVKNWYEIRKFFGHETDLSRKMPLWQNMLLPMILNKIFKLWHEKGITHLENCYNERTLMSFEQLKDTYKLSNKHVFAYLQLRNFLRCTMGDQMLLPDLFSVKQLFYDNQGLSKLISKVYSLLMQKCHKPNLDKSKERWEYNLNVTICEPLWEDLCKNSISTTINSRFNSLITTISTSSILLPRSFINIIMQFLKCVLHVAQQKVFFYMLHGNV